MQDSQSTTFHPRASITDLSGGYIPPTQLKPQNSSVFSITCSLLGRTIAMGTILGCSYACAKMIAENFSTIVHHIPSVFTSMPGILGYIVAGYRPTSAHLAIAAISVIAAVVLTYRSNRAS